MCIWKDFAQGFVVDIGHAPVWEQVIKIVVLRFSGQRTDCPFVFIRCMVEDEIEHQADALFE